MGDGDIGEKKSPVHGMHRRCRGEIMTRWHRGDDAVPQEYHRDGTGVPPWWYWSTNAVVLEYYRGGTGATTRCWKWQGIVGDTKETGNSRTNIY